jgi:hypothetical protein
MPTLRKPDDEHTGVAASLEHVLLTGRRQLWLRGDSQYPLNGKRPVGE